MGWEIANNFEELQGVNYGFSGELENGKIAFWRTEDWEIYGLGGGGYTSSGPFGSVDGDLVDWINSGSILARDALSWTYFDPTNNAARPNFSRFSSASSTRKKKMMRAIEAVNTKSLSGTYMQPAALKFAGNTNPSLGQNGTQPGDIIVIGQRLHDNSSETVRYRVFDDVGTGYTDFAQTYSFIEIARREADREAINADFSRVGGADSALNAALAAYRTKIAQILSTLGLLNADAYFAVTYTGPDGTPRTDRIRVAELISWIERIDFEVHPDPAVGADPFNNGGVGATLVTAPGLFRTQDVTLAIYRTRFIDFAATAASQNWYILHEIMHAVLAGRRIRDVFGNGVGLETRINSIARSVAQAIGLSFNDFTPGNGARPPESDTTTPPYASDVSVVLVNPSS